MQKSLKLYEKWNLDYEQNRYLSHLSLSELSERLKFSIENITTLELNGKIGCLSPKSEYGHYWWVKFSHTQREFDLRNAKPLAKFLTSSTIPEALIDRAERLKELNRIVKDKDPDLIKFSSNAYLENYSFKVSLASAFSDESLNPSQYDNELEAIFNPSPSSFTIRNKNGEKIEGISRVELNFKAAEDHYIYCTSREFDVRLFGNFNADTCLLIYDRQKFSELLSDKIRNEVAISRMEYGLVDYFDPVTNDHQKEPTIHFYKHLKYSYQKEHRHVFFHRPTENCPKHLYINIPEIAQISELVCI
jgi:hypothetical protein